MLGKFNGDEKVFKDFHFKLHKFVRQVPGLENFLDWVRLCDIEPNHGFMEHYKAQTGVALEHLNDQLYGVLSMVTEGNALQTVMNVAETYDLRGAMAWHRLTRDATGKTGARLKRLADAVHRPKEISRYSDAPNQLNVWETNVKELVKIEGQQLSELTKITILTHMVPLDLSRDIEKDKALKTFRDIWTYVMEQIEVRRHWKAERKKDPNAMDIDAAEKDEPIPSDDNPMNCPPCEGEDLDTLKGGGKGVFNRYCGYCQAWGHKRADCRKRAADIARYGKGKDGKGKDGGKDGDGGKGKGQGQWPNSGKGPWQGGWQVKGSKGKGFPSKGKGFQGSMYNIHGEQWGGAWGGSNGYQGGSGGFCWLSM